MCGWRVYVLMLGIQSCSAAWVNLLAETLIFMYVAFVTLNGSLVYKAHLELPQCTTLMATVWNAWSWSFTAMPSMRLNCVVSQRQTYQTCHPQEPLTVHRCLRMLRSSSLLFALPMLIFRALCAARDFRDSIPDKPIMEHRIDVRKRIRIWSDKFDMHTTGRYENTGSVYICWIRKPWKRIQASDLKSLEVYTILWPENLYVFFTIFWSRNLEIMCISDIVFILRSVLPYVQTLCS